MKYLRIITLIFLSICIYNSVYNEAVVYPYWIFTVLYTIFIVFSKYNVVTITPGILWLNAVLFIKYVMLPTAYSISGQLLSLDFANNYRYMTEGFILSIYEQIAIFIALAYTGRKQKSLRRFLNKEIIFDNLKIGKYAAISFLLLLAVMVIQNPNLRAGLSLLSSGGYQGPEFQSSGSSSLISILYQACGAWLFVYLCLQIRERKFLKKQLRVILIVFVTLMYLMSTFISQTRISRHYTIISTVAAYFTLIKMYPKSKKSITLYLGIPFAMFMAVSSAIKNAGHQAGSGSLLDAVSSLFNSQTLEMYYLGPVTVNSAYGLYEEFKLNITALWYDIINNMPIVNSWFDVMKASVNQYNVYIGRNWEGHIGDQVIPLVGQSLIYFTPLFAPLLSVLSVFIVRYFDKKYLTSSSMKTFAYAFTAAWCGVILSSNMTICLSWVYIRIIPLFFLFWFIEQFGVTKHAVKTKIN